jgi:hypothetical protein
LRGDIYDAREWFFCSNAFQRTRSHFLEIHRHSSEISVVTEKFMQVIISYYPYFLPDAVPLQGSGRLYSANALS